MTSQNTDLFGNNLQTRTRAWSRTATRSFSAKDKVTVKDGLQELGLLADLEKVPLKAHLKNGDIDDTSIYAIYRKPTKQDKKYIQISDR